MSASPTLAEALIDALARRGVKRLFGVPGGGSSLALIEAAGARGLDFVLARGETAAAIMAAVTGELSAAPDGAPSGTPSGTPGGTPGVVLTGVGPGAASAVNGIAYASLERAPVLLLTDGPASSLHQAFDQNALFEPVSKHQGRLRPRDGARQIEAAIDLALAPPQGPVQLDLTADDAGAGISGRASPGPSAAATGLERSLLEQARGLIAGSRRPVFLIGLEARPAPVPAAVRDFLDVVPGPVLSTYKAMGVVPESRASCVGLLTGARAEADCLGQADLIIALGLDPVELIPGRWPYRAPILDLREAGWPDPPAAACRLVGPLAETLAALLPVDSSSAWRGDEIAALRSGIGQRLALAGAGHTAQSVVEALSRSAPDGCRLTVDAGAHMFSVLAGWRAQQAYGVLKSNGLSTMGFALPAAIASALHEPARPVAAVTGDGGLMMCLTELATAVEARCRLVVVVLNDAALSLIDIKQQRQQQASRGVRTGRFDFAGAARALGCRAWRLEPDQGLEPVLAEAFAGEGPALVEISVDPSGYIDQLAALRG